MKYIYIFIFLSFCLLPSKGSKAQKTNREINRLVERYQALNEFNGAILIARNGKIMLEQSYGYQDIGNRKKISNRCIFQIGSLTKTFTAALIMKLIETGKLKRTSSLQEFFPDFPRGGEITIQELLTHSAGVYELLRNPVFYKRAKFSDSISENKLLSYFIHKPLDFAPGTSFAYSNSGYILLGMIIEKITGLKYNEALKRYIFYPLKMYQSGYGFSSLLSPYKTTGYAYLSKKRSVKAEPWNSSLTFSSGAIYSNLADLYKWSMAFNEGAFFEKSILSKAFLPYTGGYGYGWFIDTVFQKKVIYNAGNLDGATSYLARIPQDDICIILLNNITNTRLEVLGHSIMAILYNQPYALPKQPRKVRLGDSILNSYIGKYQVSDNYKIEVVKRKKQLSLILNYEPPIKIYAEKMGVFFAKDVDVNIRFEIDRRLNSQQIIIRQGLSRKVGQKIP